MHRRRTGPWPFCRKVARLGADAADALEHAHSLGVLHRDIKPANLLIDREGSVWITDFGLARFSGDSSLTGTGDVVGTLRYMSPEQALARRGVVDQRTDVYALGATLYELLTLGPAFSGRDHQELLRQIALDEPVPPRRQNPAIPRDLETIVLKAMAKDPSGRYATALELSEDMKRFLDDDRIMGRRPSPLERTVRWARRRWELVATAAAIACCRSIIVAAVKWQRGRENQASARIPSFHRHCFPPARPIGAHANADEQVMKMYTRGERAAADRQGVAGGHRPGLIATGLDANDAWHPEGAQRRSRARHDRPRGPEFDGRSSCSRNCLTWSPRPRRSPLLCRRARALRHGLPRRFHKCDTEAERIYRRAIELRREIFGNRPRRSRGSAPARR